ncbi:MAG: MATE family efflux transporter [Hyphomicrobiaceae bacterium]|nr:MATE family efflux transporter [Hyphomicrobiaceae bacterium]
MTLAYLSTPLVGLADTFAIGQIGDAALIGGIAFGSIIFDLLFTTLNSLRSGTTGLVAQAFGADDRRQEAAVLFRAFLIAALAGLAVILFRGPLLALALAFLGGSPAVQEAVTAYFAVRVLSAPFVFANYAILGHVLGLGRGGIGLLLQTILNGVNVALNLYFVLALGMGVEGVALASVIAEIVAFAAGCMWLVVRLDRHHLPRAAEVFDWPRVRRMLAVNRDIMIRSFALLFAFSLFARQGAAQGDVVLAGNAILEKFFLIGGYFLDGFATAAEQLVGRSIGARWRPAFDRAVSLTLRWGVVLAALCALCLFLGGPAIIRAITPAEDVRAMALAFLPYAALTPLAGVVAFEMDGVFIGATWSQEMRNMMLVSLALFVVAIFGLQSLIGNHGLWVALLVFLGARGVLLWLRLPVRAARAFAAP